MTKNCYGYVALLALFISSACSSPNMGFDILNDEQAWLSLANAYYESGNTEKAIDTLKDAISRMDSDTINERLREIMSYTGNGDIMHKETTESAAIDYADEADIRVEDAEDGEEWEFADDEDLDGEYVEGDTYSELKDIVSGEWEFDHIEMIGLYDSPYGINTEGYSNDNLSVDLSIDTEDDTLIMTSHYASSVLGEAMDSEERGNIEYFEGGFSCNTDFGRSLRFYYNADKDSLVLDKTTMSEVYKRKSGNGVSGDTNESSDYVAPSSSSWSRGNYNIHFNEDMALLWDPYLDYNEYMISTWGSKGKIETMCYGNSCKNIIEILTLNGCEEGEYKLEVNIYLNPEERTAPYCFCDLDFHFVPDYELFNNHLSGKWHIARYNEITPEQYYNNYVKMGYDELELEMFYETIDIVSSKKKVIIDGYWGVYENDIEFFYGSYDGHNEIGKYEGGFENIYEGGSTKFYYDYDTDTITAESGLEIFERGGY